MITDADVKKLKSVFATKDDLKKELSPVNKKLNKIVKYFDRDISWHNRRLKQLEEKAGVEAPDFAPLPLMKN